MHKKNLTKENLYINQVKETVELTNVVKIPSFSIFNKNRFAVLTTQRILIFEDKEAFLLKKACKNFFEIKTHDFYLSKTDLIIKKLREDNDQTSKLDKLNLKDVECLNKTIKFPSIELCNQWWETIKFFKVKITEDEHEMKLRLRGILKSNLHKGDDKSAKNLANYSNQDNVKFNRSKKDSERFTGDMGNNEKGSKKTKFLPEKRSNSCISNENNLLKKFTRKVKLNNSYDERIHLTNGLNNPNLKEFEKCSKKHPQDDYLKKIKAYFNHNRNTKKGNKKDRNIDNPNQFNNKTNETTSKNETLSSEISKAHSLINPNPHKSNPSDCLNQSYIEKIFDKYPKTIYFQEKSGENLFNISKKNDDPSNKSLHSQQNEKESLKLKNNQNQNKKINCIKNCDNKFPNKKINFNLQNSTKFPILEATDNQNNSGKFPILAKEQNNMGGKHVYNYTKYKEIPPYSNYPIQDYFKSFISNNIAGKKNHGDVKTLKKKMIRTQFEILSKNISTSFIEQENKQKQNEFLYDNQNKLKNKLSYKLKPIDFTNYNNPSKQSISFTHPVFSEEDISQTDFTQKDLGESKNTESNYTYTNETLKIINPVESLKLENKLGKGFEENFVDLRKLNDKIRYKDKKILNTDEIKDKINKLGLSKDFENLQKNININSSVNSNKSHYNHKTLEGVISDRKRQNFEIIDKSKSHQIDENLDYLNKATIFSNKYDNPKRNLIVLKMLRGQNSKSAEFGLSLENSEINLNKSVDNNQMLVKKNKIPQKDVCHINFVDDYKNILSNNPEKDKKIEIISLTKEKETQSALKNNKDPFGEKNEFIYTKSSKIPICFENKTPENDLIIEEHFKINNDNRSSDKSFNNKDILNDKCNPLIFKKTFNIGHLFPKKENKVSCISSNEDEKFNNLFLSSNANENNSYDNFSQNVLIKNLMSLDSTRYCFYCFRGKTDLTSNSSHHPNNMHNSISSNKRQMGFSTYLNYDKFVKQNLDKNNKFNNQQDYLLNENYHNCFLKSQKEVSISNNLSMDSNQIGIRHFYNKKKQQNYSFTNSSSSKQTLTEKSSINNNIKHQNLHSNQENFINNIQKDYCNSKIWKNLNNSLKFFEGNERQLDEVFNCDSVISFSKKYHLKNELKKSLPCNLCWQYLQTQNHESKNINNFEKTTKGKLIDTNKQKEVLLVRDINTDKNDFVLY